MGLSSFPPSAPTGSLLLAGPEWFQLEGVVQGSSAPSLRGQGGTRRPVWRSSRVVCPDVLCRHGTPQECYLSHSTGPGEGVKDKSKHGLDRQHPWKLNGNASFWAHCPRLVTPCGTWLSVLHVTNLPGRSEAATSLRATETCGWPGSVRLSPAHSAGSSPPTSHSALDGSLCPWSKRTAPPEGARPLALKEGPCGCTRAFVARA